MPRTERKPEDYAATRGANGRFGKGNPGGFGAPMATLAARLRTALLQSVTPEDIVQVGQQLTKLAKRGDLAATKLLLTYCVGAPNQPLVADTTAADALEADNRLRTAERIAELNRGFGAL